METRSVRLRRAFTEAARHVVQLVDTIADDQWGQPGLGEWSVAELVVHTTRAGSTIATYAAVPAERQVESPADYYVAALGDDGIHDAVAERTKVQTAELDGPLPDFVRHTFAEAEQVLARTPAQRVLGTIAGGIALEDYLPTRIVELVVHGSDIAVAIGSDVEVPRLPMAVTLETLAEVATVRPTGVDAVQIMRALTGRGSLPDGANLLG